MNIDVLKKADRLVMTFGIVTTFAACTAEPRRVEVEEEPRSAQAATEPKDAGAAKEPPPAIEDAGARAPVSCASFAKDVLPALAPCGATTCHGTRFGPAIRIEIDDAALTYEELTTFTLAGKPYVKIGEGDLDGSAIHCHLAGKCGAKMPPRGGNPPPASRMRSIGGSRVVRRRTEAQSLARHASQVSGA